MKILLFTLLTSMFIILAACGENNSSNSNTIVNISEEEYKNFYGESGAKYTFLDYKMMIEEINQEALQSNENKEYKKLVYDFENPTPPLGVLWDNNLIYNDDNGATIYLTESIQDYTDEYLTYYDFFKEDLDKYDALDSAGLCIELLNNKIGNSNLFVFASDSAQSFFSRIFPIKKDEIIEEIKSKGFGPEREARKINEELERLENLNIKAMVRATYNYATLRKYTYLGSIYSQNYFKVLPDDYWGDPNFPSRAQIKQNEFLKRLDDNQLSKEDNQMIRGFCEANHQINFRLKESDFLPDFDLIDANELIEELNNLGESEFIQKRKGEILIRGAISDVIKISPKVHAIFESKKVNFDNKIICNIETSITSTFSKLKSKKWNDLILVSGNLLELDEEENIIIEACNIEREY